MNIAVFGGAGFVGSALVRRLVTDGHFVTVYDNFSRGSTRNLIDKGHDICEMVTTDLTSEQPSLRRIDRVYDLAARVAGARDLYRDPATLLSDNLAITSHVLGAVAETKVPLYFYVSSSCVYDFPGAKVPHIEEDTDICDTSYGFSKVIGEQLTKWYSRQYGFSTRIARLFNVYGPGDSDRSPHVIPEFLKKAKAARQSGVFPIFGSGEQTRDFTWLGDVVEGILTITEKGAPGQPYNIGTGRQVSIMQLAEIICDAEMVHWAPQFVTEETPPPPEDIQRRAADASKLRALGWEPKITLEEGISQLVKGTVAV